MALQHTMELGLSGAPVYVSKLYDDQLQDQLYSDPMKEQIPRVRQSKRSRPVLKILNYFPIEADYSKARQSIIDLHNDPCNYSDHNPEEPSNEQIQAAIDGLDSFSRYSLPEPAIMLQEDGTYCAYWHASDGKYVSIDLESDRVFIWVIADACGEQSGQFNLEHDIPKVILDTLKR